MSEPGSSVRIVSGYGLDNQAIGFDPWQKQKTFPLASVYRLALGPTQPSCTKGTMGPFPRANARPGNDADNSPHLVLRSRMSRRYTSYPPKRLCGM
jgi:hypothetical protein